ncbi:MAG: serine/threonine-protein kinase [Planctomycetota bacterium]
MEPLVAGQVLGRFTLVARAGVGGFSEVWRARPLPGEAAELPAEVALKVPREPQFVEHLRREAALQTAAAEEPRVVPLLEVQLEHEPPFLVMPWIEGRDFPLPDGVLEPAEQVVALRRALDLVETLGRLHAAGLIHGDLKPQNLRVDAEGAVHVLDLGLGRLQLETNLQRSLAQSLVSLDGSSLAGTLDYLAPELTQGQPASPASDVYALGVLLHQALCGRSPAFGVQPSELNPFLPRGTDALVAGLLAPDPAQRQTDLSAVAAHLRWLIRQEERCLRRRNGHARRRVREHRLHTLRRGAKALALGLFVVGAGVALVALRTPRLPSAGSSSIGLVFFLGLNLLGWAFALAATTLNAWALGVPEAVYKQRPGQRLWNFLMQ